MNRKEYANVLKSVIIEVGTLIDEATKDRNDKMSKLRDDLW